ncbi:MAG TPA: hypothetical protein PK122_02200 [Candidatus Paceibacterota bacterium]|nr:hypothetical protein [Candidatus Paceibacterota bacterium]
MNGLEKRMYFFVPYNISPIQQAIQAGHAALEYARKYQNDPDFIDFADNWKTWIILNGGTTNSKLLKDSETGWYANPRTDEAPYLGSLDNIAHQLIKNKINYSLFQEPDLNDALTAVCFIADVRVWNYKDYPEFLDYILKIKMYPDALAAMPDENLVILRGQEEEHLKELFPEYYTEWIDFMGGEKNLFLRELIRGKKLA